MLKARNVLGSEHERIRPRALIDPEELADALDGWALRREKVLTLLDVRGARAARSLALQCHVLAQPGYEATIGAEEWREEWHIVRGEALAMLAPIEPDVARARNEARDSTPAPSLDHEEHDAL